MFISLLTIRSSCRNCRIHSLGKERDQQGILGTYTHSPSFPPTKTSFEETLIKSQCTHQRGTATGLFHDKLNAWRQSQRERLHWFGNNMTGTVPLLLPDGSIKHWDRADLVDKWSDVGLSGGPTQVSRSAVME